MAYVYVFPSVGENLYRIGRTRGDVGKRHQDLSPGNPHPLKTFRVIETGHINFPVFRIVSPESAL